MSGLVIDSSVSAAWMFEDEASRFTDGVLDRILVETAWVPALWVYECANVLITAQRRGRVDAVRRARLADSMMRLPLVIDREPVTIAQLEWLSDRYALSAYDAAYLELAIRRSVPLVTLDRALVTACDAANHPVLTAA